VYYETDFTCVNCALFIFDLKKLI